MNIYEKVELLRQLMLLLLLLFLPCQIIDLKDSGFDFRFDSFENRFLQVLDDVLLLLGLLVLSPHGFGHRSVAGQFIALKTVAWESFLKCLQAKW